MILKVMIEVDDDWFGPEKGKTTEQLAHRAVQDAFDHYWETLPMGTVKVTKVERVDESK